MNCSPARTVDQSILQLDADGLEGISCGAQSEDLGVLRGRRIVRVQYLRGCQTWIDVVLLRDSKFSSRLTAKIQY